MHSKDEPLFRVGSYYRNGYGALCLVRGAQHDTGIVELAGLGGELSGHWNLQTGEWSCGDLGMDLVPGELYSEGNPIDSDGLSDALSEQAKHLKGDHPDEMTFEELMADLLQPAMSDKDAAMVLRDGPAKPAPIAVAPAPVSTAHPPIAGLMRENGFSHKLGSAQIGWKR